MKSKNNSRNHPGRRLAGLMAASILAAGFLIAAPIPGQTAQAVELDTACSLTVTVEPKEMEGGPQELPDVVLDLYRVADAVPAEGQDTYSYEPSAAPYAELALEGADTQEAWQNLAQQAADITFSAGSIPDVTIENLENNRLTAADLTAGLYLVIARGRGMTAEEYIVRNTEAGGPETGTAEDAGEDAAAAGGTRIATIANSDSYVFTYEPQLVSLPTKEADEAGNVMTSNRGEWVYNAAAVLKPELSGRFAALRIDKELTSYRTGSPATFVFTVEAVLHGDVVYSDAVSLTFDGAGSQSELILDKIPVGAEVTVTEVYSGTTYQTAPGTQAVQNVTMNNTALESADFSNIASFRNEYNGTGTNGSAITNHFEYMDDGAGMVWNWTQIPAVTE